MDLNDDVYTVGISRLVYFLSVLAPLLYVFRTSRASVSLVVELRFLVLSAISKLFWNKLIAACFYPCFFLWPGSKMGLAFK